MLGRLAAWTHAADAAARAWQLSWAADGLRVRMQAIDAAVGAVRARPAAKKAGPGADELRQLRLRRLRPAIRTALIVIVLLVLDEVHLVLVARHLVGNLGEDGRFALERAERVLVEWRLQQQPRRLLLWLAAAGPHRL